MPTSAELPELSPLDELRARLMPGALLFSLADNAQALELRTELRQPGLAWVSWTQRQALLQAWRYSAQERYSSMGDKEAPTVREWLRPQFKHWKEGPDGVSSLQLDLAGLDSAIRQCGLEALADHPVSVLSNGESARACLAGALAQDPKVLVLHDLAEGLDAGGRKLLLGLGQRLAAEDRAVLFLASRPSLLPIAPPALLELEVAAQDLAHPEIFRCQALTLGASERPLIENLNWVIRGGEAWWLRGDNGIGKSTLMAYLTGEHPMAWAGSWRFLERSREAYVPLEKLREQVVLVSPEVAAAEKKPILVLLAEALTGPARLLLLDEALRGLNEEALEAWHGRLKAWLSPDRAMVFVCHDPAEIPTVLNQSLEL